MPTSKTTLKGKGVEEARKATLTAHALSGLALVDDEIRPRLIEAGRGTMDMIRESFPGATDAQLSVFAETVAALVAQIMSVPAYLLSDTLEHTSVSYAVAASALAGGYTFPEPGDEANDTVEVTDAVKEKLTAMGGLSLPVADAGEDFRPGNYL